MLVHFFQTKKSCFVRFCFGFQPIFYSFSLTYLHSKHKLYLKKKTVSYATRFAIDRIKTCKTHKQRFEKYKNALIISKNEIQKNVKYKLYVLTRLCVKYCLYRNTIFIKIAALLMRNNCLIDNFNF